jgi:hypothetical protein
MNIPSVHLETKCHCEHSETGDVAVDERLVGVDISLGHSFHQSTQNRTERREQPEQDSQNRKVTKR